MTAPATPSGMAVPVAPLLTNADLTALSLGGSFEPADGGNGLGAATLDACGGTFPSEALRTGRTEIQAMVTSTVIVFSEVVTYSTAAAATQALTELHTAASGCDPASSQPQGLGISVTYSYSRHDAGVANLPAPANEVDVVAETASNGNAQNEEAVYQVVGNVLDVTSLASSTPLTSEDMDRVTALATSSGKRLVAG